MSYMKGDHDDKRFFPGNTDAEELASKVSGGGYVNPATSGGAIGIWDDLYKQSINPKPITPIKIPTVTIPTVFVKPSDGSSTDYYKFPAGFSDLIDLIEFKNMNFAIGNIFKACFRLGEKANTDRAYDLRKIIFFAQRELDRIKNV